TGPKEDWDRQTIGGREEVKVGSVGFGIRTSDFGFRTSSTRLNAPLVSFLFPLNILRSACVSSAVMARKRLKQEACELYELVVEMQRQGASKAAIKALLIKHGYPSLDPRRFGPATNGAEIVGLVLKAYYENIEGKN